MRKMNSEIRKYIEIEITSILGYAVSKDYAQNILTTENDDGNTIMDDIIQNVMETSAWDDEGFYSADDIRFAIGRILTNRMGIPV